MQLSDPPSVRGMQKSGGDGESNGGDGRRSSPAKQPEIVMYLLGQSPSPLTGLELMLLLPSVSWVPCRLVPMLQPAWALGRARSSSAAEATSMALHAQRLAAPSIMNGGGLRSIYILAVRVCMIRVFLAAYAAAGRCCKRSILAAKLGDQVIE